MSLTLTLSLFPKQIKKYYKIVCRCHNKSYNALSFRVSFDQIKKLLLQFAQIDCNKDGLISAEDLAQYLKIPYDSCCSVLFDKLDKVTLKINIWFDFIFILSLIRIKKD